MNALRGWPDAPVYVLDVVGQRNVQTHGDKIAREARWAALYGPKAQCPPRDKMPLVSTGPLRSTSMRRTLRRTS